MTRSRIAIFEGYNAPRSYGRPTFGRRMGAPLFNNPRLQGPSLGRRGYLVEPAYTRSSYGPVTERGLHAKRLKRKKYRVKKGPNTPWQRKFKKTAKKCARVARNGRKGSYQACMKRSLKKAKRSR